MLQSMFGATLVKEVGIEGRVEPDPKTILARARKLAGALSDPERLWPKPSRKGIKIDPTAWLEDLTPLILVLEAALGDRRAAARRRR